MNVGNFLICMDATFFGISRFKQFSPFDATDRSEISGDQKRLFFAGSLSFANTPLRNAVIAKIFKMLT